MRADLDSDKAAQAALIIGRAIVQAMALLAPVPSTAPNAVHHTAGVARFVVIKLAAARLGYSPKAIEQKIANGVWIEGQQYVRAPDGRIFIDLPSVEKWITSHDNTWHAREKRAARIEAGDTSPTRSRTAR